MIICLLYDPLIWIRLVQIDVCCITYKFEFCLAIFYDLSITVSGFQGSLHTHDVSYWFRRVERARRTTIRETNENRSEIVGLHGVYIIDGLRKWKQHRWPGKFSNCWKISISNGCGFPTQELQILGQWSRSWARRQARIASALIHKNPQSVGERRTTFITSTTRATDF